jgi:hypothetical protein
MSYQTLMEVRASLTTGLNTTTALGSGAGGAEIQKRIEELPVEAYNKMTDLRPLLRSVNINQLAYIWNLVTEGTGNSWGNTSFAFFTEGSTNTAQASAKQQLFAPAVGYRADYSVSGLMVAAGMGDQLMEEARFAADAMATGEERQIIVGRNTTASSTSGNVVGGFNGLYGDKNSTARGGLMLNGVGTATLNGMLDTSTIYGTVRSTTTTYLNAQAVDATGVAGGGSTVALTLDHLDSSITKSNKRGAKNNRRIFLMSEERVDKVAALLQAQQRFLSTGNTIEFDGGFRVLSYRRIPLIGSRFMDDVAIVKVVSSSVTTTPGNADNCVFLLDLDNIFMVYVGGVNAVHVPVIGDDGTRTVYGADSSGGYYKSYGVLVMKRFDSQVTIFNLENV